MDEEQREYNFPTEDSDDTKSPPEKSPEDARAAMQQSLQQFANGVAQSLAVTHEVAKIVGPALLNFAKKAQEISVAVKPVLEAFQQWMVSFSEAILQWQIPTISEERIAGVDFKPQEVGRVRMDASPKRSNQVFL